MSLNDTPSAQRVHIGFFGLRNSGKSSLVNAVTSQHLSLVSDVAGTTTDPVSKAMELLPLGPVIITDTAGLDDVGELGEMRVKKSLQMLAKTDIAVVVADAAKGLTAEYDDLLSRLKSLDIPYVIAYNKCDLLSEIPEPAEKNVVYTSAKTGYHVHELKELIAHLPKNADSGRRIVGDLLKPHDICVLVVPIDDAAPKGRLILPQQQTIRDILEAGAIPVVCRETELAQALASLGKKPSVVITDSQAFAYVSQIVPHDVLLTSFSILMARYKGTLQGAVEGACALKSLKDGDKVLVSEGCTHHRQCGDIGTVKLPALVRKFTGKQLEFEFTSGMDFPEDLSPYSIVIHCGGCTLNEREMKRRALHAKESGVPMTNFGICIALCTGILSRSVEMFDDIRGLLE